MNTTPRVGTCETCALTDTLTIKVTHTPTYSRRMCLHCAKRWAS